MSHKKKGTGFFGFPLQEFEFSIIGKEVLTTFCKEIKIFYCSLFSLLSVRVRVSVFDLIPVIFFVRVFVSAHLRAQEMKASRVSRLHFSVIFLFCFRKAIFFHFFNTVSFVFVHVGLLQILELRPRIALRFTWV